MTPSIALKTLLFTVLVPGTVAVFVPGSLLSRWAQGVQVPSAGMALAGGFLIILGVAGYLRCAWDFGVAGRGTPAPVAPPENLVVAGFYRRTRNPMFLSVLLVLLAEALIFRSGLLFAYALAVGMVFHLLVVLFEEPLLRRRFGAAYAAYCRAVPRWGIRLNSFSPETPGANRAP